ncbi:tektin-4 [Contarinia nasturtii]|uniref:tektin-4 n=1 Tax=Contarinia nasturtii TaxID=265458 RepID=UPI0012D3E8E3|nr:tektin-4 [Contarinia nasturtii]
MNSENCVEHIPCCMKDEIEKTKKITWDDTNGQQAECQSRCESNRTIHDEMSEKMGAIGAWATGKCDWNPKSGLVGVKPIVDHYSITQFSTQEWHQRNNDIYDENHQIILQSLKIEDKSKDTTDHANALVDRHQENSTKLLRDRTHDVYRLKTTLERAIRAQMDEISTLAEQRNRMMQALVVLQKPESIATECIERRSRRPDSELIRDGPEEELIEEIALISEIRNVFNSSVNDINRQQSENRAARERLESDWSDKMHAYEIDSRNSALNNKSHEILFKPGATRFMDGQSTEDRWEAFTIQALNDCEDVRQNSIKLRAKIDAILINAARDLRTKADRVVRSFNHKIGNLDETCRKLETELTDCLKRLADTELLIENLTQSMQNMDTPMKVAQTRLDNRNRRVNVENCRDRAHFGLVEEVRSIEEATLALSISIKEAEDTRTALNQTRILIERELLLKRRTLQLDRERCMFYRSHYPSATALSGY